MSEPTKIRVFIVDDHPAVHQGLSAFLSCYDDLELVGEADDGASALRLCATRRPDVILTELFFADMDGITVTQKIRRHHPTS